MFCLKLVYVGPLAITYHTPLHRYLLYAIFSGVSILIEQANPDVQLIIPLFCYHFIIKNRIDRYFIIIIIIFINPGKKVSNTVQSYYVIVFNITYHVLKYCVFLFLFLQRSRLSNIGVIRINAVGIYYVDTNSSSARRLPEVVPVCDLWSKIQPENKS